MGEASIAKLSIYPLCHNALLFPFFLSMIIIIGTQVLKAAFTLH